MIDLSAREYFDMVKENKKKLDIIYLDKYNLSEKSLIVRCAKSRLRT